jgi:hypothetical protein
MTLYEFNALDEMEQAEAIWDGVFIGDRKDDEHRIPIISDRRLLCRSILSHRV